VGRHPRFFEEVALEWVMAYESRRLVAGYRERTWPAVPPGHVRTLDDYGVWLKQLIAASGGFLDEDTLFVYPLVDAAGDIKGLRVRQQRINFWDDTFLAFALVVSEDLEQTKYSFHYLRRGGPMIFRNDNAHAHPGHAEAPHIHRDPARPHEANPTERSIWRRRSRRSRNTKTAEISGL